MRVLPNNGCKHRITAWAEWKPCYAVNVTVLSFAMTEKVDNHGSVKTW